MADANHRISIAALTGGISKQPDHIALPGQTRTATNATCSVADGMSNRNGSRYVKRFTTLGTTGPFRMHPIDRDGTYRYVVVYGDVSGTMTITIFDTLTGTEITPTLSGDAITYLNYDNPTCDDLRFVTNADYTIIVNIKAVPTAVASANYDIVQQYRNSDILFSIQGTEGGYYKTRDDTAIYPSGYWKYSTAGGLYTERFANSVYGTIASNTWGVHDHTSGYSANANNPCGFQIGMTKFSTAITGATWTASSRTITKASAFALYTFETGDQIYLSAGTGHTPGWYTITSKTDSSNIVLAVNAGLSGSDNSDTASSGSTRGIGRNFQVSLDFRDETLTEMNDVALAIQSALRRAGCVNGCCNWTAVQASTASGYFTITSQWAGTEALIFTPTAPSTGFNMLTNTLLTSGITNNAGSGSDGTGYGPPPEERWTRVAAPNQASAKFTATTMPVKMVGTTSFAISVIGWTDRLSGDAATNPIPSPITAGYKITDAAFLDGRLWLSAGETVFSSQQGDVFNFFAFDSTNLVDSDPIEAPIGDSQVNLIEFLTPVRKGLVISTLSGRQFELTAENGFTPTSTAVTPTTSRKTHTSVRPARSDSLIYMVGPLANGSAVYEYVYDDVQITSIAGDITAHVPDLIGTSVKSIHAAPEQQVVIVLDGSGNLWHYGYFFRGQEKVQSAWTKWTRATNQIRAATIVGSDLFILRDGNSAMVLEKIPLGREAIPSTYTGFTTGVHLDCQMVVAGVHSAGTTTFTLPNSLSDTTITRGALVGGTALTLTANGTTCTVSGDYQTGSPVVVLGQPFTLTTELTRPYVRDQNGVADINKQVTMREVITKHQNTGAYTLRCVVSGSADRTKVFTPASGITEAAGTMRSWFNGDTKRQTITIESSSHLPLTITGIEYFVESSSRDI